jgi:phospholipid/cholesterol/gamma-HCH transport system substrate-binding protein
MSTPTNHWKLGLFVVIGVMAGLTASVYFGARNIPKETVTYASYFDEAVTGLEVGSAVKFRGVTIGNVSRIELATDRRHVKVSYELSVDVLRQLGIAGAAGEKTRLPIVPNLRTQLSSTGITGVKFVQIDFFEDNTPTELLPFKVRGNYIPATPSSMKNIEDSLVHAADHLPELTGQLVILLTRVNRMSEEIEAQRLPTRAGAVLAHADHTLTVLDEKLDAFDTRGLSNDAHAALSSLNGTATRTNRLLDTVAGEQGLLMSVQRASDAVGDVARNGNGFGPQFESTLRDVSAAADSIKDLADALERQPDMLLKGRARAER